MHIQPDFYEHSSVNIWSAVCAATRTAVEKSGVAPEQIAGIGFDATCSLVALDEEDRPVQLCEEGTAERNVIVWMDHRAVAQTTRINEMGHEVLKYGTCEGGKARRQGEWERARVERS